jgi:hypothetical protein
MTSWGKVNDGVFSDPELEALIGGSMAADGPTESSSFSVLSEIPLP